MTVQEYTEILAFVQEHHKFAFCLWSPEEKAARKKQFPKLDEYGFNIKYVDSCYDSRDAKIWTITFRAGIYHVHMRDSQTPDKFKSHFDWCMAYLKGEWKPTKEYTSHE